MAHDAAREWLEVVVLDLRAARNCLHGPEPTPRVAVYHCQQAAEKLAKAVLVAVGIQPPRSHNIAVLVDLLPADHQLRPQLSELEPLTVFAVAYRYPMGDVLANPPEPSREQMEGWIALIDRARAVVERMLGT